MVQCLMLVPELKVADGADRAHVHIYKVLDYLSVGTEKLLYARSSYIRVRSMRTVALISFLPFYCEL